MKIGFSKVGDGTRVGYTLMGVQGVKAELKNNKMVVTWNPVTTFYDGTAIPSVVGLQVYYQVMYSNDANFNGTTQIWTGIPGNPSPIMDGYYYMSDTFNNETPSTQAGAKYVLLKTTTDLIYEIPLRHKDATNIVSGIPASDAARNYYFEVRASFGQPDNPQALNQDLTKLQLVYPQGEYGNWGNFSALSDDSKLTDVLWSDSIYIDGKMKVAVEQDYIKKGDPQYGSISIEDGLEYRCTKRDVVGLVVLSSTNVGSIKIISTDVEGIIRDFDPNNPTQYTVEPISTVPYYVAPFNLPHLKLTSANGIKTVTLRGYVSQNATGDYVDFVITTLYDSVAPTVTSIPVLVNGHQSNIIGSTTAIVALDLTGVIDIGSGDYLVRLEGLNGSVSSKYYLYTTTLEINNDLNLQNNTTIKLKAQIFDRAKNETNKISLGDAGGDIIVQLNVNDPVASVYNPQEALSLFVNELDEASRNIALHFTNTRDVKIYVDNSGETVTYWRYVIKKGTAVIPDDIEFTTWLTYSDNLKFSTTDPNRGYAINLGSDDQTYYRVWVQIKTVGDTISNKVFYDVWLDTTIPTIESFSHTTGTTNNPDVIINNIVSSPHDPSGSPSNGRDYQMKIFGSGVAGVSRTINDIPASQNVNQWIPFSSSVRFKLDDGSEGTKVVKFTVRDFAFNAISDGSAVTEEIVLQLSGPAFAYAFVYNDGSTDSPGETPRLVNRVKGFHSNEDNTTVCYVKVKFTFSDPIKAATVTKFYIKNELTGVEQIYTDFDPNNLYTSGFLTPNPIVLSQTVENGKNSITIKVYDNALNTTTQNTFVVLDTTAPSDRNISFQNAIQGNIVTSRNINVIVSCKDRTTTKVKITGDLTDPDVGFNNQLLPAVSFNPGDNPTLDGLLHQLSGIISKTLTEGDGTKYIRVEFQDYALNTAIGTSQNPGEDVVITLDTSGGIAPLHLRAQGRFPNDEHNNYHIVLNWEAPSQEGYSVAYYNIYEIKQPPYDFDPIYGDPTYTTNGTATPTATTFLIENVPQSEIGVPRHYRVTSVVTITFNESPYSNEAPAVFAGPIKITFDFADTIPGLGSSAAIISPAAVISLPRTLSKDAVVINITPNDLASYVGQQFDRQGWDDLITKMYFWDNSVANETTKTNGNWIIITKNLPSASSYLIKEGEGLVLEFVSAATSMVHDIIFDGLPWGYETFTMPMKIGLNLIGIPRVSYSDPEALAVAVGVNKLVEVSGFNERYRNWESFVSAIPNYEPEILSAFKGGGGYFVRVTEDITVDFVGDVWPGNVD